MNIKHLLYYSIYVKLPDRQNNLGGRAVVASDGKVIRKEHEQLFGMIKMFSLPTHWLKLNGTMSVLLYVGYTSLFKNEASVGTF